MNDNTSKNLYEFATYFKRILQITIASIIIGFIGGLIAVFALEFLFVLGIILLIISVSIIVFKVLMIIRLSNAKNSSPHPELNKAFMFMLISLILAGINGIIGGVNNFVGSLGLNIFSSLLGIGGLICDLLGWQSLGKYVAVYGQEKGISQGFQMVADGIKTYIITVYIVLVCNALSIVVLFISYGIFLIAIALLIASIVMIVAQFKIANGMLMIFGGISPTQPSLQYGTPPPSFQQGSGSEEKFCRKCGAKLMPGAKFCTSCGNTI